MKWAILASVVVVAGLIRRGLDLTRENKKCKDCDFYYAYGEKYCPIGRQFAGSEVQACTGIVLEMATDKG